MLGLRTVVRAAYHYYWVINQLGKHGSLTKQARHSVSMYQYKTCPSKNILLRKKRGENFSQKYYPWGKKIFKGGGGIFPSNITPRGGGGVDSLRQY